MRVPAITEVDDGRSDPAIFAPGTLRMRDFQRLAAFIEQTSGIKMPESKRVLVEGRLRRRIRALAMAGFDEYCAYLFKGNGLAAESVHIIDAVSTNKTDFFREIDHFNFLTRTGLASLVSTGGRRTQIKAWSAPCSIGAEPYTLAMVIADFAGTRPDLRWSVLGTDINTDVLKQAVRAIYPEEMIAPVPPEMRRRYLLRARDPRRREVRIAPELRRQVKFAYLNLMDETYPADGDFDIIFCRNLLIYFEKPTQKTVLHRLVSHLRPGGYLFVGHSETIVGFGLPLHPVIPTVFVRE